MKLSTAQQTVSQDTSRFKVLVAGRRFGKSFLSINEIAKYAAIPHRRVIYVAPTFGMAKNIIWEELKNRLTAVRWVKKINESNLEIILKNMSKIMLRSADNPDSIRGGGYDLAIVDEAQDCEQRLFTEILRPALADRQGAMLVIGTPKGIGNHLYDMYNDPAFKAWQFTTLQGGRVPLEEIEAARAMMDTRTFKQEFEASFETYAGVIYQEFGAHNIIEHEPIKQDEPLHLLCDFNVNPMSGIVARKTQQGFQCLDEIVIYSGNTEELVEECRNRYPNNPWTAMPDPAGAQRKTSAGGKTDISILQNARMKVLYRTKHPAVIDRINAVNSLLKLPQDGRTPRLTISRKCKKLIESLTKQTFKEGTRIPDKDEGWDHMNDALGYGVEYYYPIKTEYEKKPTSQWGMY